MIIIIDNNSFLTPALAELVAEAVREIDVIPAGVAVARAIEAAHPVGIILGPGLADDEVMVINHSIVQSFAGRLPILGIDLGMHAIVSALGGASQPSSGLPVGCRVSTVHDQRGVFEGISTPMEVGCFTGRLIEESSLPDQFQISAHTVEGEIMGVRRRSGVPLEGVQFCPQSLLTPKGGDLIENFAEMASGGADRPRRIARGGEVA